MKPIAQEDAFLQNFNKLSDKQICALSEEGGWSLNLDEMSAIQAHFKKLNRPPTRGEIETIAQTWSEHCKHKTFSGPVDFIHNGKKEKIKNLFKETIVRSTKKLNKKWCLSVFKDNAGIIEFGKDGKYGLAYKVETHNHPCAIEPYGGAETGVGGVIRDILGVGMGAKPVACTDTFCFAPPNYKGKIPANALTPLQVLRGVVSGVRDYGNRMGIPTVSGGIEFDDDYRLNPLVYVGTAGIIPRWAIDKQAKPGDLIVCIGGRTGRDGIHGATFSSANLDEDAPASAVQIGHPLNEKKVLDALLIARDKRLYNAVTDCGAGGFSSAIGELASDCGAEVNLEQALLKDKHIAPWEIWVSESQERMILAVPPSNIGALKEICDDEDCELCILGVFTNTGRLSVNYKTTSVVNLGMEFLHSGVPNMPKKAVWNKNSGLKTQKTTSAKTIDTATALKKVLGHINVSSRQWIIRQYDHEVQGGSIVKPLGGKTGAGPMDASVVWPQTATGDVNDFSGFALGQGINPSLGKYDPYQMALACADEALRNLVCSGADISRSAFLDNFCWGSPDNEELMGALVLAAKGCYDAAVGYGVPFISGKDSFYNQSKDVNGKDLAIPCTLLISAIGLVRDVRKAVTADLKGVDNSLFLIGETCNETAGSVYSKITGDSNGQYPKVNVKTALKSYRALQKAIEKGLVLSAHDLSDGGLGACAAEMAFTGKTGACLHLEKVNFKGKDKTDSAVLFSQTQSRILVEVSAENEKKFLGAMKGINVSPVGHTIPEPYLIVKGGKGGIVVYEGLDNLRGIWQRSLGAVITGVKK